MGYVGPDAVGVDGDDGMSSLLLILYFSTDKSTNPKNPTKQSYILAPKEEAYDRASVSL